MAANGTDGGLGQLPGHHRDNQNVPLHSKNNNILFSAVKSNNAQASLRARIPQTVPSSLATSTRELSEVGKCSHFPLEKFPNPQSQTFSGHPVLCPCSPSPFPCNSQGIPLFLLTRAPARDNGLGGVWEKGAAREAAKPLHPV